MPTISTFYGIIIRIFFDEHAPPHFHEEYAEFGAQIANETLDDSQASFRDARSRSFWNGLHCTMRS